MKSNWFARSILFPFFVTRAGMVVAAFLALQFLPNLKRPEFEIGRNGMIGPALSQPGTVAYPFVRMWARWDSRWLLGIAKDGYQFRTGKQSNSAFFPLYPLVVRGFHALVPFSTDAGWLTIGILISNAALLIALAYLYRLLRLDYSEVTSARAVLYLLVFPTTLFLSAFYSEALFLALVVSAFYYARTERWLCSALLAAAAATCRPPGVVLLVPLAVEYLAQKKFNWKEVKADCLALLLIPLGTASYLFFLRAQFGSWGVLQTTEGAWDRKFTFPWNTFVFYFSRAHHFGGFHTPLNLLFTLVFCWLTILSCQKLRLSYATYAVVSMIFITSWATFMSVPRFGLAIFPLVLVLALAGESARFHRSFLLSSSALAVCGMVAFALWGWVA